MIKLEPIVNPKVGDKVFSLNYGNGVIDDINEYAQFPIQVNFPQLVPNDSRCIEIFTKEGKFDSVDKYPSLFNGNFNILDDKLNIYLADESDE